MKCPPRQIEDLEELARAAKDLAEALKEMETAVREITMELKPAKGNGWEHMLGG